jgi:propanol-preferring alcohol dehydrogenase
MKRRILTSRETRVNAGRLQRGASPLWWRAMGSKVPEVMRAVVATGPGAELVVEDRAVPAAGPGEVLLRVRACGVCRTDLHLVDGELPQAEFPVVPGHQIVAEVVGGEGHPMGARVGVPWLGWTCGECARCLADHENLCERAEFTGCQRDGGFAEYCVADARYCFPIPAGMGDVRAAPLLCAGLIGYRAYRMAGDAPKLGLYGFGSAAHVLTQVARHEGREVYAFTRPGDEDGQHFARDLGAVWAGTSEETPPALLDAAIIFAPVGALVPTALRAIAPGGRVVCAGIHMSDIPSFPYRDLWKERGIVSVANLTRRDAAEFLALAPTIPVETHVSAYALDRVADALADLRAGRLQGSAVIVPGRGGR